jgi:ribonuclease HIII
MEDPRLAALQEAIEARGWRWRPGKPIPYGTQVLVEDGRDQATLNYYPRQGRTVVGGRDTPLRRALQELALVTAGFVVEHAEIGLDESGKGDWFGPLVVAAVCVDPAVAPALLRAGVRDSKTIASGRMADLAATIVDLIPASARAVTVLEPLAYNERYAAAGNVNVLLAELYAATAAPVVAQTGVSAIICDQFAQGAARLETAFAVAGLPRPRQVHHAEGLSLAVAAASVLATARFQEELARLGALAGWEGPLPSGAADRPLLERAARWIIAREGPEGLARYAKLHFQPVRALLGER